MGLLYYFNVDGVLLQTRARFGKPIDTLSVMRGTEQVQIIIVDRNGTPTTLPGGSTFIFGAKAPDDFNNVDFVCSVSSWTITSVNSGHVYTGALLTATTAIDAALKVASDDVPPNTGGLVSAPFQGQFSFIAPASQPTGAQIFAFNVQNNVVRGTEGASPGTNPPTYRSAGYVLKNADYTAFAADKLACDTTAIAFTITLPPTPTIGDEIQFADAQGTWATNNLTVARNGNLIMGAASDLVRNVSGDSFGLVWAGGATGWRMIQEGQAGGAGGNLLALNTGNALISFGDSITVEPNQVAGVPHSYVYYLSQAKNYTLTDFAAGGAQVPDQAPLVYATVVDATNQQFTADLGTNDQRINGVNANSLAMFTLGMQAIAGWLAIPDAAKIYATNTALISYVGSWVDSPLYPFPNSQQSRFSGSMGDTATVELSGNTVYVGFTAGDGNDGTFTVTVDGGTPASFNSNPACSTHTPNGASYIAQLLRITGLGEGAHSVVITNTNAAGGLYFDWASGSVGVNQLTGPNVYIGNVIRQEAGYAGGGSDANVFAYNAALRTMVAGLQSDGLNVALVDVSPYLNQTTDHTDVLHPSTAGQIKMSEAFLFVMNSLSLAGDRQASHG